MIDNVKKPEQAPAEGDRDVIERELARQDGKAAPEKQTDGKTSRQ